MTRLGLILCLLLAVSVPVLGLPVWTFTAAVLIALLLRYRGDLKARIL